MPSSAEPIGSFGKIELLPHVAGDHPAAPISAASVIVCQSNSEVTFTG
jgi:hypothetical protein